MRHADPSTIRRARGERGSVMLEALVSIVVTSMAMLASAALAINAAKVNQTGRYRAQAVVLVNDIAERLTANPASAADGSYALAANEGGPGSDGTTLANCSTSQCTPLQYAQSDLAAWRAKVMSELPQATASLVFTAVNGTTPASYAITVTWVERSTGHGGGTRTNAGNVATTEPFAFASTVVLRPR